ncbi:g4017 [Coccomyxa viridis]|uniref:G4017 protein n=1 Tax=Coccomyxa viridis TaxID=1274662 RepID=A0ABP1FSG3_9CHLO
MKIKVLFFARARELAGTTEAEADLPEGSTAKEAMQMLLEKYPDLREIEGEEGKCVLALNQEYLEKNATTALKEGDEIAIIPPISGG